MLWRCLGVGGKIVKTQLAQLSLKMAYERTVPFLNIVTFGGRGMWGLMVHCQHP